MSQTQTSEPLESSDKVRLLAIPPADVDRVWPIAEPMLARATDLTQKIDTRSLRGELLHGRMQLWIIADPGEVHASMVTTLRVFTSGWRTCQVLLVGGRGAHHWMDEMIGTLENYAMDEGCHAIEFASTPGTESTRLEGVTAGAGLQLPGYEEVERVYSKELQYG